MRKKQTMEEVIQQLKKNESVVHWHEIEGKQAIYTPFPENMEKRLQESLQKRGIAQLYTHQATAFHYAMNRQSTVIVTPTASGKTMCYNLPVLQEILADASSRALYLFPTKALSQDQMSELHEWIDDMGASIHTYTYDGDTPSGIRTKVRKAGHIVITNPDMLHAAILPHHQKWVSLFENLKYIVIDELHMYRGVFGSHVANVIRRLLRICEYYGSSPTFICTSATIANPKELAEQLTGQHIVLVDNNGAPIGKKHFIFYNPKVVNEAFNIRKSATKEAVHLAQSFLEEGIQTIVFGKSRVRVELMLSHLLPLVQKEFGPKSIRAYRGGYLPNERREIEKGLRRGEIKGVISTNALELGVDIGSLQVCIMCGYPNSISSTWQQAGRAGRRQGESIVILVASNDPMDQYIIQHPDYFFTQSPETARIEPNNLVILVDHLKCAAFELPFHQGESFGELAIDDILQFLAEEKVLHFQQNKYYWMSASFPAHNISLRSASQENVVIIDQTNVAKPMIIGEMDRFSALTLLHEEAIYLHQGVQYQVETLDWEEKKAFVREVSVEYFTDANLAVQLKVLEEDEKKEQHHMSIAYGDVMVNAMATIFKKIRLSSFENIGSGPIHLPEVELHTNAMWIQWEEDRTNQWSEAELEQILLGTSHLLKSIAPVFVMCAPQDIHVVPQVKAIHTGKPTIFIYDRYPGGIGLSKTIYQQLDKIIAEAMTWMDHCACQNGCPSCVGAHVKKDIVRQFFAENRK